MVSQLKQINKEIFQLAGPNIISNISVPLLSSVDTALMGHLSSHHLGAIGISAMLFNFLYWNFGFLRMGTTGTTSQAFGANDKAAMVHTLLRAFLLSVLFAGTLILLQWPLSHFGFYLLHTPNEHLSLAMAYFSVRIWAAPATLALYVALGWFFGMQNAIYPLFITIGINAINMMFSFLLVVHADWGIYGVAWGTVIAQYAGLFIAIALWFYRYSSFEQWIRWSYIWDLAAFKPFLSLNTNIFIRTLCLSFSFGFFYNRSSYLGPLIVDANVVLLQFLHWMSYGIDGFAYAAESILGKYKGAWNQKMFRLALRWSFIWGGVLAISYAVCYYLLGEHIVNIFTNIPMVQHLAYDYVPWLVVLPLVGFASYIWDGVFVGITAGNAMRNSMILALCAYLTAYFIFPSNWENHGLWMALMVFLAARALVQWYLYARYSWTLN